MFPKGIFIDCLCILIGTNIGIMIKKYISNNLKNYLNTIFGIVAIVIGIISIIKLNFLPAVIFSLILGALIGEITRLDLKIKFFFQNLIEKFNFKIPEDKEKYMEFYLLVTITLCASGTNIFGSIIEGATGDYTILLSKAVMDIFAAIIFATILGLPMNLIVFPQFIILSCFFYLAKIFMPLITPFMLNDFIAIGGVLTFVLGINIANIKQINAINLLPSLLFVWPASFLFNLILH